jgi:AcrR family transcriptional regulator
VSKGRGRYSSPIQQERRRRILGAARMQLDSLGIAALTMQNIADASDVSLKTLYNLFGSRELLLLEAAWELLDNLEISDPVQNAKPGIERLMAYTEGAIKGFEYTPEYARVIVSILLRAERDHPTADAQLGRVQQVAQHSLTAAVEQGELRDDFDLDALSHLICANQWGVVLLWEKGMLSLAQLATQTSLSHHLTLTPLCIGRRKQLMEAKLQELLRA